MALDSEAKRWGMLQVANGPGSYSHVINPTGSNFDSQIERLTLLKIYGGDLSADTTAPVLSNPTGTATGATTAAGTVETDEGDGTLYYWATQNASETAANIKANGDTQSVTASGTQNVSITGLSEGVAYYIHYVHDDAALNESNVQSSASFETLESADTPTGGYDFWDEFARELDRKRRDKARRIAAREEAEQIEDDLSRQIALEERLIEEDQARKAELARVTRLVAAGRSAVLQLEDDRLTAIMDDAIERQTFSAMERLERVLTRQYEEEMFLLMATQILINE